MSKKYIITADAECIVGYLRYGHYEGQLTEEQYQEYLKLETDKDREDFVKDMCNLVIDSYCVNDCDPPTNIDILEIQ